MNIPRFRLCVFAGLVVGGLFFNTCMCIFFPQGWMLSAAQSGHKAHAELDEKNVAGEPHGSSAPGDDLIPGATEVEKDRNLRTEQLAEAKKLYQRFPQSDNVIYLLGLIYEEQGDSTKAVELWEKSISIDPLRPDVYISLGRVLYKKELYDRAAQMLEKALELSPGMQKARYYLAELEMKRGRFEKVVALLGNHAENDPEALNRLGEAYLQLNRLKEAMLSFEKAVALNHELVNAYYGLIRVCRKLHEAEKLKHYSDVFRSLKSRGQKEGRDSRRTYDSLKITKRSTAHTHTDIARVYAAKREAVKAEALYRRALALDPLYLHAYYYLGVLYESTSQLEKAAPLYKKLIELNPRNGMQYIYLGSVQLRLKQVDQAEKNFHKAIELGPDRPEGYIALAHLYFYTGDNLRYAAFLAEKGVELSPVARNFALLGRIYHLQGLTEKAAEALRKALEKDPGNKQYQVLYRQLMNE